nr:aldehyde dehydrogenase family protein [Fredinandcohnia onubensis]
MREYKMYINGKWEQSASGKYFDTINPSTETVLARITEGQREDASNAVLAAKRASAKYKRYSPWERSELLLNIAGVIDKRKEELARVLSEEQGKPYHTEALAEVSNAVKTFQEAAEQIKWLESSVIPVEDKNKRVFNIYQPRGVYAIVTPWNFPFMIPTEYLSAGLAAGNTIVWVPAPTTSLCAIKLMECMEEADLPKGFVNLVTGYGHIVGDEIVSHPQTDAIGFTGSSKTGKQIAIRGAGKPLLLELGGNGPTIVLKDADLEFAATSIADGCFANAGQVCSSTERILVHREVYKEMKTLLFNEVDKVRLGDPFDPLTTMGPLNNLDVVKKNIEHAQDSQNRGAQILRGGRVNTKLGNYFFEPTLIVDVPEDSLYNMAETFGPVIPLIPFDSNEEALRIANHNEWGLVNAVFTNNLNDTQYFSDNLQAGIVNINENSNYWEPHIPFGGASGKKSGIGRIGGKHSLIAMSDLKTICINFPIK